MIDADGETVSFDVPFKFDNTVATLANIISWIQGLAIQIDAISEGKVTKLRFCLVAGLPSGLKSAALANSDNEKTGLMTFSVTGSPNKFGVDIPAFLQTKFTGNQIATGDPTVAAAIAYLTTANFNVTPADRYENALATVSTAVKTFRKHRRALRRA